MSGYEADPHEFEAQLEQEERMSEQSHTITKLVDGLGFGHGNISGDLSEQLEVKSKLDEALSSPRLLVKVDVDKETGEMLDDDGCGDGRGVTVVFKLNETFEKFKKSLNRAKVFGGGATMSTAVRIGLGESKGTSLVQTFKIAAADLIAHNIGFGGHTATHKKDGGCGCGAIDEAPEIIRSAIQYEAQIRTAIGALGVDLQETDVDLNEIFLNFRAESVSIPGQDYNGQKVMDESIIANGMVVKELSDVHLEAAIILNKKYGYTVDQKFVREVTGNKAQVFAVDVWRLERIARGLFPEDQAKQRKAFLSELVYTLSAAAVLTEGNLPVHITEDTPLPAAV